MSLGLIALSIPVIICLCFIPEWDNTFPLQMTLITFVIANIVFLCINEICYKRLTDKLCLTSETNTDYDFTYERNKKHQENMQLPFFIFCLTTVLLMFVTTYYLFFKSVDILIIL